VDNHQLVDPHDQLCAAGSGGVSPQFSPALPPANVASSLGVTSITALRLSIAEVFVQADNA
jgi:hypothetical protein